MYNLHFPWKPEALTDYSLAWWWGVRLLLVLLVDLFYWAVGSELIVEFENICWKHIKIFFMFPQFLTSGIWIVCRIIQLSK